MTIVKQEQMTPQRPTTNKLDQRIATELAQYTNPEYTQQFLKHSEIQHTIKRYVQLYRQCTDTTQIHTYRAEFIQYTMQECNRLSIWYNNKINTLCTQQQNLTVEQQCDACYECQQFIQLNLEVLVKLLGVYDNYTNTGVTSEVTKYLSTLPIYKHTQLLDQIQQLEQLKQQHDDTDVPSPCDDHILADTAEHNHYNANYTDTFQSIHSDHTPTNRAAMKQRGFSCHQCKSTKATHLLLFCSHRSAPSKEHKNGKKCRKKYCDACLRRWYNTSVYDTAPEQLHCWTCPACYGQCLCATCRRKPNNDSTYVQHTEHSDYSSLTNLLSPTTETGIANLTVTSPSTQHTFTVPTKQISHSHKRKQYDESEFVAPIALQSQYRTMSHNTQTQSQQSVHTAMPERAVSDMGSYSNHNNNNNSQHNTMQYTNNNDHSTIQRYNNNNNSEYRPTKTPRNSMITPQQRDQSYDKLGSPTSYNTMKRNSLLLDVKTLPLMSIVVPGAKKQLQDTVSSTGSTNSNKRYSLSQSNQLYSNMQIVLPSTGPSALGDRKQSITLHDKQLVLTPLNLSLQSPANNMLAYTPVDMDSKDMNVLNKSRQSLMLPRNSIMSSSPFQLGIQTPLNNSLVNFGLGTPADNMNLSSQRRNSWSIAL